jgi:hypothetical protein
MDSAAIRSSIAYCGLICGLCQPGEVCNCRSNNHCGKRHAPEGCCQYTCCTAKGIGGCWECPDAPCGKDMHEAGKVKIRAFITCMKEDGPDRFAEYVVRNAQRGIVYHRAGITGDYDLETEADVLGLLRTGRA